MNVHTHCCLALRLAENAQEIEDPMKFLLLLEQTFIAVFKKKEVQRSTSTEIGSSALPSPSPRDLASQEEEKLMLVKAIQLFHEVGKGRHQAFFQSTDYHNHAALFLLELLKSLQGNSKQWFRQLQVSALCTCKSIIEVLSLKSIRGCLPGVASATVRYIQRSHHGKDSNIVRLYSIDLLELVITKSFSEASDAEWIRLTAAHLAGSLSSVTSPKKLLECHYDTPALVKFQSLLAAILRSPAVSPSEDFSLFRELSVNFLVLNSMCHLSELSAGDVEEVTGLADSDSNGASPITSTAISESQQAFLSARSLEPILESELVRQYIVDALHQLRGVPLLHLATSVARLPCLRSVLVNDLGGNEEGLLCRNVIQKCVRCVCREMPLEDLYTYKRPRKHPAGVVDEFLETIAHALAESPFLHEGVVQGGPTAGERITNILMEDALEVLDNWDIYALHPATTYVIGRIVLWQFKPLPSYLLNRYFHTDSSCFPFPEDFMECTVLEQLWSIIGLRHLWNIDEDELLCTTQQIHHRHTMACIILRILDLVASDVISEAVKRDIEANGEGEKGFDRLCAITLYPVMEKASIHGAVHDAAMHCLESYIAASGDASPLTFFARISNYVVDEATRAIKEGFMRQKVATVLVGVSKFLSYHVLHSRHAETFRSGEYSHEDEQHQSEEETSPPFFSSYFHSTSLPQLVKQVLSPSGVTAALKQCRLEECYVSSTAEFLVIILGIATPSITEAMTDMDHTGTGVLLGLLKDSLDLAALLNFSSAQEVLGDDDDRITTSCIGAVKKLQHAVLATSRMLQTDALRTQSCVTGAVQAMIRCIICFLTTSNALKNRQESEEAEPKVKKSIFQPVDPDTVPWFPHEATDGSVQPQIQLPRTALPSVYQTYLPLLSLLKEPIARFVTAASTIASRSRIEMRELSMVPITDGFSAALEGLHALLLLAFDFLEHRYVTEVAPVVLVWYERALLPSIPTPSETRAKQRVCDFLNVVRAECSNSVSIDEAKKEVERSIKEYQKRRHELLQQHIQGRSTKKNGRSTENVFLRREDLYIAGGKDGGEKNYVE